MFRVLLLTIIAFELSESSIVKRPTREDLSVRRTRVVLPDFPIEDVHRELGRLRRATSGGDPTFTKSVLNDTNNRGIVQYSGYEVIFVLTYSINGQTVASSNLYRSDDYGANFTKINSRIGDGSVILTNRIFISPEDPKKVYVADSTSPKLYVSSNGGITFTGRTLSPSSISSFSLLDHPTEEDWVLALDQTNNALYVSRDLGKTAFKKIAENVYSARDYQWGEAPYDQDSSIVYYNTDDPSETSTEVHLYTQQYPYNDATRKEFDPSLGLHDAFLMVDRYIFAQKTVNGEITLWVSADRQPFKLAQIPSTYAHQNYIVDSVKSLQALVIIQHTNNQFNLYMSEEKGVLYYLALSDITVQAVQYRYFIDLEVIESMNYTTHIANQNVRDPSTNVPSVTRTLISFDAGANWDILTPPTNADSECIQPLCSLHLHMSTSDYWRTGVYSQESAPGIIIAHGVTGQYLNNHTNTNLFISTDGGSTWSQTLDGTWGVSVLDHGGLIVAARDYHNGADESRTLMYTCDEGDSWSQLTFTLEDIAVFAVITEPGETTTVVSLYGIESVGWVVVTVNFTNIFSSVCGSNDYYNWTAFDPNTDTGCLLGASVIIERRIPSHCCLNGEKYDREVGYKICACTEEDFECDYGYMHANGYSGPCVRDESVTLDVPCGNGELTYLQSQGYNKIGGDACKGGVESNYMHVEVQCCLSNLDSNNNSDITPIVLGGVVLVALVIIAVFAVVLIVCLVKLYRSRGSTGGYSTVPISYHRENTPPPGVHNINYDEDDDDDKPLAP